MGQASSDLGSHTEVSLLARVYGGGADSFLSLCGYTGTCLMVAVTKGCVRVILLVGIGYLKEARVSSVNLQAHEAYLAVSLCLCWVSAERKLSSVGSGMQGQIWLPKNFKVFKAVHKVQFKCPIN